ncbi:MAG TPA: DUF3109 family protein [Polyangiales bacterium]
MDDFSTPLRIKGYLVAPELFTTGYAAGNGPCACVSACCHRGAYIDLGERDRILAHAEAVAAEMDETQSRDPSTWFEPGELVDPDFVSGKCVGTAVVSGTCALLDKRGYCSLQVMANQAGLHKWAIKPIYCVLFPIEVLDGVIRWNPAMQGKQACCSVQARFETPLFEACREELVHLIGEDGYQAVRDHYSAQLARRDATR